MGINTPQWPSNSGKIYTMTRITASDMMVVAEYIKVNDDRFCSPPKYNGVLSKLVEEKAIAHSSQSGVSSHFSEVLQEMKAATGLVKATVPSTEELIVRHDVQGKGLLTLTKLSGKAPRLPLSSPSIQPSSSSFLTFLMRSPTCKVSSSSCTAS